MKNSQKNPKYDCPNKALMNKALTTAEQTWLESKNQRKGAKEFSEQSKKVQIRSMHEMVRPL